MAHIWLEENGAGEWMTWPLNGGLYRLSSGGLTGVEEAELHNGDLAGRQALLVRRGGETVEEWVLMAGNGAGVRVNGEPVWLGLCVLRDRDEITLPGAEPDGTHRCFFSTERLARVEPFPGAPAGPVYCARCKLPINRGDLAVQCSNPECGAWHHQSDEFPCWTYHTKCALCNQATELDAGYRWTPEEL